MNFQPLIFRLECPDSEVKFYKAPASDPFQLLEYIKEIYKTEEIEEIIFEDMEIVEISLELKQELEKFHNLTSLGFNRCNMKSLNNLPELKIQRFMADDNQIKDNQLIQLTKYNTLQSLSLINNNISSQESLSVFQRLQIVQLNVYGNPFKEFQRKLLFTKLHRMIYLDNLPINGSDVIYSGDYNDLQRIDGYIQQDLKVYEK